ncbi:MAG TPA: protein kinase [Ktedonobacteraceae bacterium]|nr:protein kinase [Ktedonobacteraceae bacterium]
MLALEGRQLGNYDVIKRIRVGGMGAVYEGRQRTAFDRRVAIKVILGDYASDRDMRRRFAREARTIARLHHPHILPLIEFGDEKGMLYLVMPFIEGGTLTSYLRRNIPELSEISSMFQQLLDAVEYAHDEGLIHRDIKSSNVLLEMRRSGSPYVYLADFGLVRTAQQMEYEQAGKPIPLDQVPGTPHYMAPEQTWGVVTTATDIYALGVLLYQVLTGELPYDDEDEIKIIEMHLHAPIPLPGERDITIPAALNDVVRTAMAKRAEERYSTVAEFRAAFLAAVQGSVISTDTINEAEDGLPVDEVTFPSPRPRPLSMPLVPLDGPEPMPLPRRAPRVATEASARARVRTTDSIRERQRTTGSVVGKTGRVGSVESARKGRKHRRLIFPVVAAAMVPVILLILLIMPHVLGISFFPVGFPVFGADPVATVSITGASKTLQNTFLLTATSQAQQPDVTTGIIPDHTISDAVADSRLTQTTGSSSTPGTQAQGQVLFVNRSHQPVVVAAGLIITALSGVEVRTTQSVVVQGRADGQDGAATAGAIAVNAGAVGNIAANVLSTSCCGGLTVSNPNAFSGGIDGHTIQLVSQADITRVSGSLRTELQQQVLQKLQKQLHTNEVMASPPAYTATVTSDQPVGAPASSVRVEMTLSAAVTVYDRSVAQNVAAQSLNMQAIHTLGNNYRVQGNIVTDSTRVMPQSAKGILYLSIAVHGVWVYYFSPQELAQWSESIKGTTSAVALAFLNSRPGVSAVEIHLPFGTDHFPTSTNQIKFTQLNQ